MSRIEKVIEQLSEYIYNHEFVHEDKIKAILRTHFEEVHNEAVSATVIAENRKHAGKGAQTPKYVD